MPHKNNTQPRGQKEKVNKQSLVRLVSQKSELTTDVVERVVNTFLDTVVEKIDEGAKVSIREFGQWYAEEFPERTIYSPAQDMKIVLPTRSKVIFKPGIRLRTKPVTVKKKK